MGKSQDTTMEKPILVVTGFEANDAFMHILAKARNLAMEHSMDWDKIRSEAMSSSVEHGKEVLAKYFEVV
jgi:hypothetical protein